MPKQKRTLGEARRNALLGKINPAIEVGGTPEPQVEQQVTFNLWEMFQVMLEQNGLSYETKKGIVYAKDPLGDTWSFTIPMKEVS